jgi:hypothetical protein
LGEKIKDSLDEIGFFDVDLSGINTAEDSLRNMNQTLNSVSNKSEKFARTLEYLSESVSLGGGQSFSQLGGRTKEKRLLDEIGFSGTKSQLELSKSLNSLNDSISSSFGTKSATNRKSSQIEFSENNLDYASALEPVIESIQQGFNDRAQKLGVKSTSELSSSSDSDVETLYKKLLETISRENGAGKNLPINLSMATSREGYLAGAKIIENAFFVSNY